MDISPIYLLSEMNEKNLTDDTTKTHTERKVIPRARSIAQSEFWQAQASGFLPEVKLSCGHSNTAVSRA